MIGKVGRSLHATSKKDEQQPNPLPDTNLQAAHCPQRQQQYSQIRNNIRHARTFRKHLDVEAPSIRDRLVPVEVERHTLKHDCNRERKPSCEDEKSEYFSGSALPPLRQDVEVEEDDGELGEGDGSWVEDFLDHDALEVLWYLSRIGGEDVFHVSTCSCFLDHDWV
jgi:hypothetical protein